MGHLRYLEGEVAYSLAEGCVQIPVNEKSSRDWLFLAVGDVQLAVTGVLNLSNIGARIAVQWHILMSILSSFCAPVCSLFCASMPSNEFE